MKEHGSLFMWPRPLPKHVGLKWLSERRSALLGLSFMERAPLFQLTPANGNMSGLIVSSTCYSSFALMTLKDVSIVNVVSRSFHILIL